MLFFGGLIPIQPNLSKTLTEFSDKVNHHITPNNLLSNFLIVFRKAVKRIHWKPYSAFQISVYMNCVVFTKLSLIIGYHVIIFDLHFQILLVQSVKRIFMELPNPSIISRFLMKSSQGAQGSPNNRFISGLLRQVPRTH